MTDSMRRTANFFCYKGIAQLRIQEVHCSFWMPSKTEMTTWLDLFTWNLNMLTSPFYYIWFLRVAQVDTRQW